MSVETKSYDIYDLKTGRLTARISAEGIVQSVGDAEAWHLYRS